MIIIFMGPPGAGKGTQAVNTAKKYNIPHISTGEMFRDEMKSGSELGNLAKSYADNGILVPDEVTSALVESRIQRPDCKNGFLLDGYPRNIAQAEFFQSLLDRLNLKLTCVLDLKVNDDELITRLTGRWNCPSCGTNYHDTFLPPSVKGKCDNCDSDLVKRKDDEEETVKFRLQVYYDNTFPLIEYYKDSGVMVEVDGLGDVDEVLERITNKVDQLI